MRYVLSILFVLWPTVLLAQNDGSNIGVQKAGDYTTAILLDELSEAMAFFLSGAMRGIWEANESVVFNGGEPLFCADTTRLNNAAVIPMLRQITRDVPFAVLWPLPDTLILAFQELYPCEGHETIFGRPIPPPR